ncbi:MAG TPA: GntR family transcriptional regulator [Methanocellales archaeon]|nr:GntR family transcriptional regulator [Methanocellales archaeon]
MQSAIYKIQVKTLHQEVAQQIQEMIYSDALLRGRKIDERRLSEMLGVSRTPIREALRILSSEGLIDLVPHKGAFVSEFTAKEIEDMFEVMSVLEGTAARQATVNMTSEQFSRIESLHKQLEIQYQNKDHKSYLEINNVLHLYIQELAGNKALNSVVRGLRQKILIYRHKQLYQPERFNHSIQEHRAILHAFRIRDSSLAEMGMKQHLIAQSEALVRVSFKDERVLDQKIDRP